MPEEYGFLADGFSLSWVLSPAGTSQAGEEGLVEPPVVPLGPGSPKVDPGTTRPTKLFLVYNSLPVKSELVPGACQNFWMLREKKLLFLNVTFFM